jgi:hypothetical protein
MFMFDHSIVIILISVFILILYYSAGIILLVIDILDHHAIEITIEGIVLLHLLVVPVPIFTRFHYPMSFYFS